MEFVYGLSFRISLFSTSLRCTSLQNKCFGEPTLPLARFLNGERMKVGNFSDRVVPANQHSSLSQLWLRCVLINYYLLMTQPHLSGVSFVMVVDASDVGRRVITASECRSSSHGLVHAYCQSCLHNIINFTELELKRKQLNLLLLMTMAFLMLLLLF